MRPTTDRVREAIGSILESRDAIRNANVLDLFAGTGALGFEALSRGARSCTFVDQDAALLSEIRKTAVALQVTSAVSTVRSDLLKATDAIAKHGPFQLVFADPPYDRIESVPPILRAIRDACNRALIVLEHATREPPTELDAFIVEGRYRYGDSSVLLLTLIDT